MQEIISAIDNEITALEIRKQELVAAKDLILGINTSSVMGEKPRKRGPRRTKRSHTAPGLLKGALLGLYRIHGTLTSKEGKILLEKEKFPFAKGTNRLNCLQSMNSNLLKQGVLDRRVLPARGVGYFIKTHKIGRPSKSGNIQHGVTKDVENFMKKYAVDWMTSMQVRDAMETGGYKFLSTRPNRNLPGILHYIWKRGGLERKQVNRQRGFKTNYFRRNK